MKDKTDVKINNIMPCVPTRDLVVFPGMSMHFDVGRPRTIKSMKNAIIMNMQLVKHLVEKRERIK